MSAGVKPREAEAHAKLQPQIFTELLTNHIATKEDIRQLDRKIDATAERLDHKIDTSVVNLPHKIDTAATNLEHKMEDLAQGILAAGIQLDHKIDRTDQKGEKESIRLDAKIDHLEAVFTGKFNLLYWMMGFSISISLGVLYKLFHL